MSTEFGHDYSLIHEAVVTGRKVGAGKSFWAALAHNEELFKQVVDLVNQMPNYRIVVDYTLSLLQMISAGHYDWTNESITLDHFPIHGTGKQDKEVMLFHFNRCISSDDAKREMNEAGYRPASIEDLLALGAAYPDLQRQFPIAALANPWHVSDGHRYVAYLRRSGSWRSLGLHWLRYDWSEDWRFLAVRK